MNKDALDSAETLYWRSQPGALEDAADAQRELKVGETLGADAVRARYGLSPRNHDHPPKAV